MIRTYAAKVTPENAPAIIADAAKFDLNVDYLMDSHEHAADYGEELYAILSINPKTNQATFTEMWAADFGDNWQFTGATHGPHFRVVTLKS